MSRSDATNAFSTVSKSASSWRAAKRFADAGVAYEVGILREECEAVIARYADHRTRGLPWTIAKWAMSADGRLADASRRARQSFISIHA